MSRKFRLRKLVGLLLRNHKEGIMREEGWLDITGGGTTDVGVWDSPATGYGEGIICITDDWPTV